MQLKLFHASSVRIEKFHIPHGGLHFGGINSALEAALRKIRASRYDINPLNYVYLHECTLNINTVYETDDLCGADDWAKEIEFAKCSTNADAIKYWNKYEPDMVYSYLIWNSSLVQIDNVSVIHEDKAEDMLKVNLCLI